MEDTPHCLLAGDGALKFAKKIGFPVLDNPVELATEESHERSRDANNYLGTAEKYISVGAVEDKGTVTGQGFDTVGAVALDSNGRLASATSTGINSKFLHQQNLQKFTWQAEFQFIRPSVNPMKL